MKLHIGLMICYICLQTISNSFVEAGMNVSIVNVTVYQTDPTYTKLYKLEVTPNSVVFAEGDLLKELQSIYVTLQVFLRINGNLRLLLERKMFNYCGFVKRHRGNTLFDSAFYNVIKYSNIPKEGCPVPPAKYIINGFVIKLSRLPSIVPSGNYLAKVKVITLEGKKKKKIILIHGSGEVQLVN